MLGVRAASEGLRDRTDVSLECAAKAAFKSGVEAEADGLRSEREKDGRVRRVVDVAVVVMLALFGGGPVGARKKG